MDGLVDSVILPTWTILMVKKGHTERNLQPSYSFQEQVFGLWGELPRENQQAPHWKATKMPTAAQYETGLCPYFCVVSNIYLFSIQTQVCLHRVCNQNHNLWLQSWPLHISLQQSHHTLRRVRYKSVLLPSFYLFSSFVKAIHLTLIWSWCKHV